MLLEGSLVVVALVLAWLLAVPLARQFQATWSDLAWAVLATMPMVIGLIYVRQSRWRPLARINVVVEELVDELFASATIFDLAIVSLLAGVGEEMLFRGVLQSWLTRLAGPLAALVAVSILFGAVHWITHAYAVLAAVIGVYLGWLFLHFDNLVVPMLVHGLYDFVALLAVMYWPRGEHNGDGRTDAPTPGEDFQEEDSQETGVPADPN